MGHPCPVTGKIFIYPLPPDGEGTNDNTHTEAAQLYQSRHKAATQPSMENLDASIERMRRWQIATRAARRTKERRERAAREETKRRAQAGETSGGMGDVANDAWGS